VPLRALHIGLGARGNTLVCRWAVKEVGHLRVLRRAHLAPGSPARMVVQLGAGAAAPFAGAGWLCR
jgi:hypothetical protein